VKGRVALISINPEYAMKIISGEKRLEFRRSWTTAPVDMLAIYATSPVKRIVAVTEVKEVFSGSRTYIWNLSRTMGGGISRRKLFGYLQGKTKATAIELAAIKPINGGVDPRKLFGGNFRPPQSFRYLTEEEYLKLDNLING